MCVCVKSIKYTVSIYSIFFLLPIYFWTQKSWTWPKNALYFLYHSCQPSYSSKFILINFFGISSLFFLLKNNGWYSIFYTFTQISVNVCLKPLFIFDKYYVFILILMTFPTVISFSFTLEANFSSISVLPFLSSKAVVLFGWWEELCKHFFLLIHQLLARKEGLFLSVLI